MKPKFRTKVWHNRQWQLSPDQDLILFLNSVRDAESLINCGTVAQTCGPLKRMVSEPLCNSFNSRKRKVVRVPQIILTFLLTKNLSHKSWIQATFGLIHFRHFVTKLSAVEHPHQGTVCYL